MTTSAFLAALADSLVPGGLFMHGIDMPSGSSVGCDHALSDALAGAASPLRDLMGALASKAGSHDAFVTASPSSRELMLRKIQEKEPARFAQVVTLVLSHYYAQPQVLSAIGWQTRPPQPDGHRLEPFDDSMLDPVRKRGAIWRHA